MAETQQTETTERRAPPGANGGEHEPTDLEAALRELKDIKAKYGAVLNESKAAKKAREELTAKLRDWNSLADETGVDPEQMRALLSKQQEADLNQARDRGEIDKLLENQRKTFEKQLKQQEAVLQAERALNNKILLDSVLREELAKVCDPDLLDGVFALHRPKIEMVEDSESEYGRCAAVNVGGEHMTVAEYVKNWAENDEKAARYLKPSMANGGGAAGGVGSNPRLRFKARKEMTPLEKSQYIRTHGKAEYDKLPWSRD